jgi:hypothetical protein
VPPKWRSGFLERKVLISESRVVRSYGRRQWGGLRKTLFQICGYMSITTFVDIC